MFAVRRSAVKAASTVSRAGLVNVVSQRSMATFYSKDHEYIKVSGDKKSGVVGISNYAQEALGELVYCDLPAVGAEVTKGSSFGAVESTKSASDVYSPVNGEVLKINEALADTVSLINSAAETDGWMIEVSINDSKDLEGLMDEAAYAAYVATLDH